MRYRVVLVLLIFFILNEVSGGRKTSSRKSPSKSSGNSNSRTSSSSSSSDRHRSQSGGSSHNKDTARLPQIPSHSESHSPQYPKRNDPANSNGGSINKFIQSEAGIALPKQTSAKRKPNTTLGNSSDRKHPQQAGNFTRNGARNVSNNRLKHHHRLSSTNGTRVNQHNVTSYQNVSTKAFNGTKSHLNGTNNIDNDHQQYNYSNFNQKKFPGPNKSSHEHNSNSSHYDHDRYHSKGNTTISGNINATSHLSYNKTIPINIGVNQDISGKNNQSVNPKQWQEFQNPPNVGWDIPDRTQYAQSGSAGQYGTINQGPYYIPGANPVAGDRGLYNNHGIGVQESYGYPSGGIQGSYNPAAGIQGPNIYPAAGNQGPVSYPVSGIQGAQYYPIGGNQGPYSYPSAGSGAIYYYQEPNYYNNGGSNMASGIKKVGGVIKTVAGEVAKQAAGSAILRKIEDLRRTTRKNTTDIRVPKLGTTRSFNLYSSTESTYEYSSEPTDITGFSASTDFSTTSYSNNDSTSRNSSLSEQTNTRSPLRLQ